MTNNETIMLQKFGKIEAKYEPNATDVDDYDPHEYRNISHPITNTETLIHIFKGSLGIGILAMPDAFRNAGIVSGFIFTILIGTLCTYGLHILVQAQYILCKRKRVPLLTYPDSMKAALLSGPRIFHAFANASSILVDTFLVMYQLGICCGYVIFVAASFKRLIDTYLSEDLSIVLYALFLLIPFILILSVPNLKWLAPFSLFSNVITFVCFGIVLYYIFNDLPSISERSYVGAFYTFPLYFGTTFFALEAIGVVIVLESNMKTPKSFGGSFGVLNVSMFCIILLNVGIGFLGYWRYGDETHSSVILNFPLEDTLAKIVQGLYSLAIFISYGLQGYVPVDILWNTYLAHRFSDSKYPKLWEYLLRAVTVFVTFALAISMPRLGIFISLFGAFALSALGIVFPAIMEICVKWPNDLGAGNWILIKDIALIAVGICSLLFGIYSCALEMNIGFSSIQFHSIQYYLFMLQK
ncbi:hypothetical protein ILUMI_27207 [Ignelater luminosus]|uniref:Amino acid transporter transmembrane domain-containing protein n=1 Tax=Ignelater luminosus TaxID=2038154 RepID=A0A8K0FY68_IGNLU|nr:hypothetical protein ILUMI_27207 [Ignelater luminosus]